MSRWVPRIRPVSPSGALWIFSVGWILAIALITLFWGLNDIGLIDETEPLFVEAARRMVLTGDWITPYFDGVTRFDKPPLIYWLMGLAFKGFGFSEWSARLPSALTASAIILFSFYVLHRNSAPLNPALSTAPSHPRRSWIAASLGATMLMLNLNTYFWGRTGYADMLLMATMGGSFLAFFMGYASDKPSIQRKWYDGFYVLLALAVLTKGPIALLLSILIIGGFTAYLGNIHQVIRELRWVRGALIVLGLGLPWYVLVTIANGRAFIDDFFGYHNLTRFSSVVNQHSGPWYFHILVIMAGFLPWSVYLPMALYRVQPWRRTLWQGRSRSEQLSLYAWIWFGIILGFFTISVTKYFSYTLPLMPAAAILVGLLWTDDLLSPQRPRWWDWSRWLNIGVLGALAWALTACPAWLHDDPWMPTLGQKIAEAQIPVIGGWVWGIAAVAAVLCVLGRSHKLWLVNMIAFVLFIVLVLHPAIAIVDQVRQLPLRELAYTAVKVKQPEEDLAMIGFKKPSLVFYTQRHVEYLDTPSQLQPYLKQSKQNSHLVVATPKLLAKTGLQPNQYQPIADAGVYTLVRIPPNPPTGGRSQPK